jgi:hypothetical protein
MAEGVIDRDLGWGKAIKGFARADGVELRVGISKRFKYPKKRGKTQVMKVAALHGIFKKWAKVFDSYSTTAFAAAMQRIRQRMIKGHPVDEVIMEEMGIPLKDLFILGAGEVVDLESGTGLMKKSIRSSVWDKNTRIGGEAM